MHHFGTCGVRPVPNPAGFEALAELGTISAAGSSAPRERPWFRNRCARSKSLSLVYALVPRPRKAFGADDMFRATAARMRRLKRLFINLIVLMEIDCTPGVAFEAGVEEA